MYYPGTKRSDDKMKGRQNQGEVQLLLWINEVIMSVSFLLGQIIYNVRELIP